MTKFGAIRAFRAALGLISVERGDHFTLAGLVYPSLITPPNDTRAVTTDSAQSWAYVCVPLDNDQDEFSTGEESRSFVVRVIGFVGESSDDPYQSNQVELLCNLEDDIRKAVNPPVGVGSKRWNLGGECTSILASRCDSIAGWPQKGQKYGELEFAFNVKQMVG